jgi:hypothetical protein
METRQQNPRVSLREFAQSFELVSRRGDRFVADNSDVTFQRQRRDFAVVTVNRADTHNVRRPFVEETLWRIEPRLRADFMREGTRGFVVETVA